MKKFIAIISALVIAASMTACAADNDANETAETTAATTTAAETEAATEATETETTSAAEAEATETEAETEAETSTENIEDVLASRADGLWAIDLANKASQWSANVKVNVSYEMGGVVSNMEIETLGDKFISKVEVVDMMSSTQIFDGTNYYMIDGVKKTYCINPNGSEGVDNYMLAVDETDSFTDAGIEEIGGTKYIYEEYDRMGEITRYYFDEFGNLAHYSVNMYGEVTYMTMTVEFADEADETVFAPPADCTELSYDDYINQYME
ncbi:MAG: hypothetical protein J6K17_02950 [Oscillospiraceae bacterium]|nr:hypothetical protein [Oscillospiraceae bacterium]